MAYCLSVLAAAFSFGFINIWKKKENQTIPNLNIRYLRHHTYVILEQNPVNKKLTYISWYKFF